MPFDLPSLPPPGHGIVGPGVERVAVRMFSDGVSEATVLPCPAESRRCRLPPPPGPEHGWDRVLSLPFRMSASRGLLFLSGDLRCFWALDGSPGEWEPAPPLSSPRMALVALLTNPSPFAKFCRELPTASGMHSGLPGELSENPWPCGLHLQWFRVLMGTRCHAANAQMPPGTAALRVFAPLDSSVSLLKSLRVGAVVSAAWRQKSELPSMLGDLSARTGVPEEEIGWDSLPPLCSG